jgi:hypothetical protein
MPVQEQNMAIDVIIEDEEVAGHPTTPVREENMSIQAIIED